jgi:phosphate transport system permease protein
MDTLFKNAVAGAALLVALLLGGIIVALVIGAWPTLSTMGPAFLWTAEWDPVQEKYGALIPIYGTLATSFIALLIALPVSVGIAMFLTELCPEVLRKPISLAVELLAAIPSIIYGMWGLFIFAPLFMEKIQPHVIALFEKVPVLNAIFGGPGIGIGIFTAGLILSIMAIPFISTVIREVFAQVPPMLKESAYGLGATTWEVVWKVMLPYTRIGVIGAVMLGLGRALGETMAVTFVIGNAHRLAPSLFAPGNSIASTLANEFTEATNKMHLSALIELGLILFLITLTVLTISRLMLRQLAKGSGT